MPSSSNTTTRDGPERSHVGEPDAIGGAQQHTGEATGGDLLGRHAVRLTRSPKARPDGEIDIAPHDGSDDAGGQRRIVRPIAVDEGQDRGVGARGRHPGPARRSIAAPRLDHDMGPGGASDVDGSIPRSAIDDDDLVEPEAEQLLRQRADCRLLFKARDNHADDRRFGTDPHLSAPARCSTVMGGIRQRLLRHRDRIACHGSSVLRRVVRTSQIPAAAVSPITRLQRPKKAEPSGLNP